MTASDSTTRFGYNARAGLTFDLGGGALQLLVEASYNSVSTTRDTEFVPIGFTFRF